MTRSNIRTLCTRHFKEMTRVLIYWGVPGLPDQNSTVAFRCEVEGCGLLYDGINGYHERPEGRIKRSESRVHCEKDGLPMYVAAHDPQGSVQRYPCAQFNCSGSKTVRGQSV